MSNNFNEQIRELRTDYKFGWLEEIMKQYFKEALQEFVKDQQSLENEMKPLLTMDDIAKRFKVTKATIHNWINRGVITGKKIGKNRYFTEEEVKEALSKYGFRHYDN